MSLLHALGQHTVTRTKDFLSRTRPASHHVQSASARKCGYPQSAQVNPPRAGQWRAKGQIGNFPTNNFFSKTCLFVTYNKLQSFCPFPPKISAGCGPCA